MGTELLPFDEVAALIATASVLGVLLLTPLYFSQRRDISRLREWMESEPEHAATELMRSEERLDRSEVELERLYAERGEPVPGAAETATEVRPDATPPAQPAASRVTSERPALERITMERSALEPHPRWRRFAAEATRTRWLAALALIALVVAAAAIVGVQGILEDDPDPEGTTDPTGIEVAVLNTTSAGGLGGQVSRQIERAGYLSGEVDTLVRDADQTVVMYEPGQRRAAMRVAKELGDVAVQKLDRQAEEAAPTANVVVILGEDRVGG